MSNRTHIVRTQTAQRWQCSHCSQKPVADSQDKQIALVFNKKSPGVYQYQLRVLQLNANGIHIELPLLEYILKATNVNVVCIQKTKLQLKHKTHKLRNFIAVRCNRPVRSEARGGGIMIYKRIQIPYKISYPQANNSSAMEKQTTEIPTPIVKRSPYLIGVFRQ